MPMTEQERKEKKAEYDRRYREANKEKILARREASRQTVKEENQ